MRNSLPRERVINCRLFAHFHNGNSYSKIDELLTTKKEGFFTATLRTSPLHQLGKRWTNWNKKSEPIFQKFSFMYYFFLSITDGLSLHWHKNLHTFCWFCGFIIVKTNVSNSSPKNFFVQMLNPNWEKIDIWILMAINRS